MNRLINRVGIAASFALLLACGLTAQESSDRPRQENRLRERMLDRLLDNVFRAPRGVTLTDEQKANLEALREKRGPEVGPKLLELQQKVGAVYTLEQQQARLAAQREARQAKKSGRELRQAVEAAVKLTAEQEKQLRLLRREQQELQRSVRREITEALGLPAPRGNRGRQTARVRPTHANVKYGPHERNVLDFWQAESDQPTPLLVSIHGGGFRGGNKSVSGPLLAQCLEAGISVAAITYRLSQHAIAPASFTDSARAIQFLRHNAEAWNIDPKRIAATGGSAGAGISLWLGFHDDMADPDSDDPVLRHSTRLTCMFVNNGQTSYDPRFIRELFSGTDTYRHSALAQLFGVDLGKLDDLPEEKYRLFEECSAITHLTKDDPPVILNYNRPLDAKVTNQGIGIHHAKFGKVLKERMDALGIDCRVYAAGESLDGGERLSTIDFLQQRFGLNE